MTLRYFRILNIIALILAACCVAANAQNDTIPPLDSLYIQLPKAKDKPEKALILYRIALKQDRVDSTALYAQKAIDLAREIGDDKIVANSYGLLAWVEFHNNNYTQSCLYAQEGLIIADSIGVKEAQANMHYYLGNGYGMMNDYNTAITHFNKAIEIYEELSNITWKCSILRNLASVEMTNMLYDDARKHIQEAITHDVASNNIGGMAEDYFQIGDVAMNQYESNRYGNPNIALLHEAKRHYLLSLEYGDMAGDVYINTHTSVSYAALLLEEASLTSSKIERADLLASCKAYLDKASLWANEYGFDIENNYIANHSCLWLIMSGKLHEAKTKLDSLSTEYLADEKSNNDNIQFVYRCYSEYYRALGKHDEALKYANMYHEHKYNSRQIDFLANSVRSVMAGEYDNKMREREIRYSIEAAQSRVQMYAVLAILFMVLVLTFVVVRSFVRSRIINQKLDQKNAELEQQKEEVQAQNERLEEQRNLLIDAQTKITDSISYASLIQSAAMPCENLLANLIGEHFVIFRPKDIVSGDFYWVREHDGIVMFAVADCTGHGVPGAFVSMLGISILNEISAKISRDNVSAASLLNELRTKLKSALHQGNTDNENRDGMDIALLVINREKGEMHYAGAYRPLLICHSGTMEVINGDRMPIGVYTNVESSFTDHTLSLTSGDMLYLFTDGIVDQFGFDKTQNKESKYTIRQLKELLTRIHGIPCKDQAVVIQETIDRWRKVGTDMESEQTDDNLIVGIRIS
ncbi:MAG: SpoIIE family protein phosphatase [Bacteroidia bacterium]|nr:SpoIIE family protein phosphatase [Bacteroidia bacterium]